MTVLMNEPQDLALDPEEIEGLRESIADVLANESDTRAVHDFIDGKAALDRSIWEQAGQLGWLALTVPERDGGLGLGAQGLALISRELGARAAPGPFIPTLAVAQWLSEFAGEEHRAAFIPALIGGEHSAAVPGLLGETKALVIDGEAITGSLDMFGAADAGLFVVPVDSAGSQGWALVRAGQGVSAEALDIWDQTRTLATVTFENAAVAAVMLDQDGSLGRRLTALVAVAAAADSLGAAENIAYKTVEYLKERVQFERPVASFQALKHRCADLIERVSVHDYIVQQATESLDRRSPDGPMWANLAKAGATDTAAWVTADCIQLFGGVGHTWEYDPHIYQKRARFDQALIAPNRILRDRAMQSLAQAIGEGRTTTELDA